MSEYTLSENCDNLHLYQICVNKNAISRKKAIIIFFFVVLLQKILKM